MIESLKDDAGNLDLSTYFGFHMTNKGKEFLCAGKIRSKLSVFIENRNAPDYLRQISLGKVKEFIPVDKTGWKNGVLV